MQFLRNIGSVVGPAGGYDLTGQTFGYWPTLALPGLSAPMHRGEVEVVVLHQQNAGLDAAKFHSDAVDDGVKQVVEFKDGADLLRGLLHRNQNVHAALLENRGV